MDSEIFKNFVIAVHGDFEGVKSMLETALRAAGGNLEQLAALKGRP